MASLFQFSSLISVKDFKQKIALAVDEEDTSLERCVMGTLKLSSEMDTTQETLTELKDVCRYIKFLSVCQLNYQVLICRLSSFTWSNLSM